MSAHPEHSTFTLSHRRGVWEPAAPVEPRGWVGWRKRRECLRNGGHWWHPADTMLAWFCCWCGACRDGMPKDGSHRERLRSCAVAGLGSGRTMRNARGIQVTEFKIREGDPEPLCGATRGKAGRVRCELPHNGPDHIGRDRLGRWHSWTTPEDIIKEIEMSNEKRDYETALRLMSFVGKTAPARAAKVGDIVVYSGPLHVEGGSLRKEAAEYLVTREYYDRGVQVSELRDADSDDPSDLARFVWRQQDTRVVRRAMYTDPNSLGSRSIDSHLATMQAELPTEESR